MKVDTRMLATRSHGPCWGYGRIFQKDVAPTQVGARTMWAIEDVSGYLALTLGRTLSALRACMLKCRHRFKGVRILITS